MNGWLTLTSLVTLTLLSISRDLHFAWMFDQVQRGSTVDLIAVMLLFSLPLMAWSIIRHRLSHTLPSAHDMVVHHMSDAVILLDAQAHIVEANPAAEQLLRAPAARIIGRPVSEWFGCFGQPVVQFLHQYDGCEEFAYSSGDELHFIQLRISPMQSARPGAHGRILLARDVTEQRRAEHQAVQLAVEQEKSKLLHEFMDVTSHDINTPLTTLRISTDLLRIQTERLPAQLVKLRARTILNGAEDSIADLDKLVQSVAVNTGRIHESTVRLQRLVGEMLEMVRLDKQLRLEITNDSLNSVSETVIRQSGPAAIEKGIGLTFEPDPHLPLARIDAGRLAVALQHLVRNAITHTPGGGAIQIRTLCHNDAAVIEVRDNGIGIPPADLPLIFDRFYRVDKARSSQTGGMGLGLAITKKIVEAHGGRVDVRSTVGEGTVFRISLPLSADSAPQIRSTP
jgi:PAS domain S-box-containing protein